MYPVLLQFGNFELRSYGVIFALSLLVGFWLSSKEAARKGLDPGLIQDFALYSILGGIVGARIYFVLFSEPGYFSQHPWEILAIWHGGIGVIGSLLGGAVVAFWYSRKNHIPFLKFGDILVPGIALAQTLGQFACLLNGDSYGRPTNLPWAITYTDPRSLAPLNVLLHPIEIYEMAAYFVVFLIVWKTRTRYQSDGVALFAYLFTYGIARFLVEFFRGSPAIFAAGIPAAQVFGSAMVLTAVLGFLWFKFDRSLRFAR